MPEYPLLDLRVQRPASGHYVYRFSGSTGELLYIGSTTNFWIRAGNHVREHADWWPEVDWSRTVVELVSPEPCQRSRTCILPAHEQMIRYETALIRSFHPRYNTKLTGLCHKKLHDLAEHGRVQLNGTVGCYTCQLARQAAQYDPVVKRAQRARRRARQAAVAGQLTLGEAFT